MLKTKFEKWSISLPTSLGIEARRLATKESRTKSELMREALRHYLSRSSRILLEESPYMLPEEIIENLRSAGLYSKAFLSDLKEALKYADKENKWQG